MKHVYAVCFVFALFATPSLSHNSNCNGSVQSVKDAIAEWNEMMQYGRGTETVNAYIEKFESVFVDCGLFTKGIRVKTGYDLAYHNTIDGVLGILSMNILVLKRLD